MVPRLVTVPAMLPILTGVIVAAVAAVHQPSHLAVLAPVSMPSPVRGGNLGGYWGLGKSLVAASLGGILVVIRAAAGLASTTDVIAIVVGLCLLVSGPFLTYRASRLVAHDHPHVHPRTSHEHIHLHHQDSQTHDHDRAPAGLLDGAWSPFNLCTALPVLGLSVSSSLIYLVILVVSSILSMSVFGYWLGNSPRRDTEPGWVINSQRSTGFAAFALGVVWVLSVWPG